MVYISYMVVEKCGFDVVKLEVIWDYEWSDFFSDVECVVFMVV